jgi:hypothetical protein
VDTATDAEGTARHYSYNVRGQVVRSWGGTMPPFEVSYDASGRPVRLSVYADGTSSEWSGNVWPCVPGESEVWSWAYAASTGRLVSATFPDGRRLLAVRDPAGRSVRQIHVRADGESSTEEHACDARTGDHVVSVPLGLPAPFVDLYTVHFGSTFVAGPAFPGEACACRWQRLPPSVLGPTFMPSTVWRNSVEDRYRCPEQTLDFARSPASVLCALGAGRDDSLPSLPHGAILSGDIAECGFILSHTGTSGPGNCPSLDSKTGYYPGTPRLVCPRDAARYPWDVFAGKPCPLPLFAPQPPARGEADERVQISYFETQLRKLAAPVPRGIPSPGVRQAVKAIVRFAKTHGRAEGVAAPPEQ